MSFPGAVFFVSAGIVVWSLHFAAVYGLTALACARGWEQIVPAFIAAATAVAIAASLVVIVVGWRRRGEFEYWLGAALAGFGLLAIVYEAIPVLMVPACA